MSKTAFSTVVRCDGCGTLRAYPRPLCATCHSPEASPFVPSGRGTIYTFSVVHRAPSAAFADEVPYTIVLVDLVEGVRVPGRLTSDSPASCGASVALADGAADYPVFRVVPSDS